MDTNIEQKRIETYRAATSQIQELYGSHLLGGVLGSLIKELKITEENRKEFIDVTGDIILGFDPKSQLTSLLVEKIGLSQENARDAAQRILPLLISLPDLPPTVPEANPELKERLELRPKGVMGGVETTSAEPLTPTPLVQSAPQKEQKTSVQPLTREELMNALATKRTMASDMAAATKKQGDAP